MTNHLNIIRGSLALAGVLAASTIRAAAPPTVSVGINPSQLVRTGATVTLSLDARVLKKIKADAKKSKSKLPLTFQWQINGQNIYGATNYIYAITNVSFSDVASYTLVLSGPVEDQSPPTHLSVYSLFESNSNGGCLGVPIGQFSSGNNTVCGAPSFDRYKVYFPFYGPNASPQSGTFQNTSGSANLDLTTCTNVNGTTMDTAIKLQGNWSGTPEIVCNNDASCTNNSLLSFCTASLSPNSGSNSNSYRATIYFKSGTLGNNTNVTFQWYYHN